MLEKFGDEPGIIDVNSPEFRAFASRLSEDTDPEKFLLSLQRLQIPCPWGDLIEDEEIYRVISDCPELGHIIPNAPIELILGCGKYYEKQEESDLFLHKDTRFLIQSDQFHPHVMSGNYILMDLNKPETLNVFTYDELGCIFESNQHEMACAKAIYDLLMPGG